MSDLRGLSPTYKAVLQNNSLVWIDDAPEAASGGQPMTVYVTITEEPLPARAKEQREEVMAILNRLAARNTLC